MLSNKTIVVTGATSGIGLATAESLVRWGVFVIGTGRSAERCQEAETLLRSINREARVIYLVADLALQSQVRSLAVKIQETLAEHGKTGLDGLINNAGLFTYSFTRTAEGYEMQWAVNHLSAFLLTYELLPLLQSVPLARVITVSSNSHKGMQLNWSDIQLERHYNGLRAYGQTKLANILFTLELNRRMGDRSPVKAFAANPGLVKTDIGLKGTPALVRWLWKFHRASGISPEESAKGLVYLVSEPSIQDSPEVYWKHGAPRPASQYALDPESAERLWLLSEEMCGIRSEDR